MSDPLPPSTPFQRRDAEIFGVLLIRDLITADDPDFWLRAFGFIYEARRAADAARARGPRGQEPTKYPDEPSGTD